MRVEDMNVLAAISGAGAPGEAGPGHSEASGTQPGAPAPALAQLARERRRADAANARADRESRRATQALERAAAAEARLAALEGSAAWQATWPIRRLAHAIPRPLYDLVRGRRPQPQHEGGTAAPPATPEAAPVPGRQPVALLIDNYWPRPDRDAGSVEIVNLAEALKAFGYRVLFAAAVDEGDAALDAGRLALDLEGRDMLLARGMHCLGPADAPSTKAFLERQGAGLALVVLNRLYCGGRFMEDVRRHCTGARVVFNTIDLHYLRMRREATLSGDLAGFAAAEAAQRREESLARDADATIVVSDTERDLLAASVPDANIVVLPLARDAQAPAAPFERRSGVGFIGGFAHAPNLDAIRFFLAEIWPLVLQGDPGCSLSIVGAGLPDAVLDGAPGTVRYLGAIADTAPWFGSLRLTVAPLRYGAGVKGKVVSSLAAGVPCVGTATALEGMGLPEGAGALQADAPALFAQHVLRLNGDARLWGELSAGGLAHVAAHFSPSAWRAALAEALWTLDALPEAAGRPWVP